MTAAVRSPYVWSVAWGGGAMVALPERDVVDWVLDVGGLDDDMGPVPADGAVTLHHPDGRYTRPGTYSAAQLSEVAAWTLTASGHPQACGRMVPSPALPLAVGEPQPRTWLLESDATPALLSRGRWRIPEGDLASAAAAITAASGVTVSTQIGVVPTAEADLDAIDWSGTLAGLLGRLARIVAGWAPQQADGSILLVSSGSAHVGLPQGSINYRSALLDAADTRVGLRTDLARTVTVVPFPTEEDPRRRIVQVTGAVARYGRSATVIELWAGLEAALRAGYTAAEPWEEVELALLDAARDDSAAETTRLALQCRDVRPGRVIVATLPDLSGVDIERRSVVAGVRLTGGHGRTPRRLARAIVTHAEAVDVVVPPLAGITGTGLTVPAPRLTVDGADVTVSWFNRLGNADVARRALYFPPNDPAAAAGVIVAADGSSPQGDTPGFGAWQYRLRMPPTSGDWGPWRTARIGSPPAPTLSAVDNTVTVSWPAALGAVDIRRIAGLVRTGHWEIIAAAEAGTIDGQDRTHTDDGVAGGGWYYAIRQPPTTGEWSEPALIIIDSPVTPTGDDPIPPPDPTDAPSRVEFPADPALAHGNVCVGRPDSISAAEDWAWRSRPVGSAEWTVHHGDFHDVELQCRWLSPGVYEVAAAFEDPTDTYPRGWSDPWTNVVVVRSPGPEVRSGVAGQVDNVIVARQYAGDWTVRYTLDGVVLQVERRDLEEHSDGERVPTGTLEVHVRVNQEGAPWSEGTVRIIPALPTPAAPALSGGPGSSRVDITPPPHTAYLPAYSWQIEWGATQSTDAGDAVRRLSESYGKDFGEDVLYVRVRYVGFGDAASPWSDVASIDIN